MKVQKIKIKDINRDDLIALLEDDNSYTVITTVKAVQNYTISFAHIMPNDEIQRYGQVIGYRENIEHVDESFDIDFNIIGMFRAVMKPEHFFTEYEE